MEQIVGVDVGGTFTDLILIDESSGGVCISKVPSTPENQAYGVMEARKAASVDLPALKILIHGPRSPPTPCWSGKSAGLD